MKCDSRGNNRGPQQLCRKCSANFSTKALICLNPSLDSAQVGLERNDFSSNRHPALSFCLSMIFSENRYPLFRIMPQAALRSSPTAAVLTGHSRITQPLAGLFVGPAGNSEALGESITRGRARVALGRFGAMHGRGA